VDLVQELSSIISSVGEHLELSELEPIRREEADDISDETLSCLLSDELFHKDKAKSARL
jgi:hypothetical protein